MCRGRGSVRNSRSVAAAILRQLRRGFEEGTHQEAVVTVSEDVLDALVNRRRDDLVGLENEVGKRIVVLPGHDLGQQRFQIDFR
jgi:Ribonuclease G/E